MKFLYTFYLYSPKDDPRPDKVVEPATIDFHGLVRRALRLLDRLLGAPLDRANFAGLGVGCIEADFCR